MTRLWWLVRFRGGLNLNRYIGKKVHNNSLMGFKIWWSWGLEYTNSKIPIGRTAFCFLRINFNFCGRHVLVLSKKCILFLGSLVRQCRPPNRLPTGPLAGWLWVKVKKKWKWKSEKKWKKVKKVKKKVKQSEKKWKKMKKKTIQKSEKWKVK